MLSFWLVVVLTVVTASGRLPALRLPLPRRMLMLAAEAVRCQPKSALLVRECLTPMDTLTKEQEDRSKRFDSAERVIRVGFQVNALLMVMKLAAGWFGRSEAVFADGLESACDFVAIGSAMIALRIGRKPYDRQHPYGHGKAESLASILVSLVIFATGIGIVCQAAHVIYSGNFEIPSWMPWSPRRSRS